MYYLIDTNRNILASCKEKNETYNRVITLFKNIVESDILQVIDWNVIDKSGYFFKKIDDNYILRKYDLFDGYIYNSCIFEEICNIMVNQHNFKEDIKKSYMDIIRERKHKDIKVETMRI